MRVSGGSIRIDRSQFNRRACGLRWLLEKLRQHWLELLGATAATELLLDTKPVPVLSYKRSERHSNFAGGELWRVMGHDSGTPSAWPGRRSRRFRPDEEGLSCPGAVQHQVSFKDKRWKHRFC